MTNEAVNHNLPIDASPNGEILPTQRQLAIACSEDVAGWAAMISDWLQTALPPSQPFE